MSGFLVIALVALLGLIAFFVGRSRAASLDGASQKVHSRPQYHGAWAMLLATLPALLFFIVWSVGQSSYIERQIGAQVFAQSGDTAHTSTTLVTKSRQRDRQA